MTRGISLWPFTPPSAFCRSMRASNPDGELAFSEAPSPVRSVTYARVIGAAPVTFVVGGVDDEHPANTIGKMTTGHSKHFLTLPLIRIVPPSEVGGKWRL